MTAEALGIVWGDSKYIMDSSKPPVKDGEGEDKHVVTDLDLQIRGRGSGGLKRMFFGPLGLSFV